MTGYPLLTIVHIKAAIDKLSGRLAGKAESSVTGALKRLQRLLDDHGMPGHSATGPRPTRC
jgi:hypothetical protein